MYCGLQGRIWTKFLVNTFPSIYFAMACHFMNISSHHFIVRHNVCWIGYSPTLTHDWVKLLVVNDWFLGHMKSAGLVILQH